MKEGWRPLDTDYEQARREISRRKVEEQRKLSYYDLFQRHDHGIDTRALGPLEIPPDATPEPYLPGEGLDDSYINFAAAVLKPIMKP